MSARQTLAQRRAELIARCEWQRAELATQAQVARNSMAGVNAGMDLLARVRQNRWMMAGLALAVIVIKPRRIMSCLQNGVLVWQAWRNVVPAIQNFLKRP